jgi:pimeloyl-ACP methyl ester carboxylesterase
MNLFYKNQLDSYSPARLAPSVRVPVMMIHGEADRRFPLAFARTLRQQFKPGQSQLFVAKGAGHSDSSTTDGYSGAVRSFVDQHWIDN